MSDEEAPFLQPQVEDIRKSGKSTKGWKYWCLYHLFPNQPVARVLVMSLILSSIAILASWVVYDTT